jgi:hypothetical protein
MCEALGLIPRAIKEKKGNSLVVLKKPDISAEQHSCCCSVHTREMKHISMQGLNYEYS